MEKKVMYWRSFRARSAKRALRSTGGKKIWLSMHQRNFGSDKIVRTYVRSPLHVSGCEMVHLLRVQGIYISVFNLVLDFHVIVN